MSKKSSTGKILGAVGIGCAATGCLCAVAFALLVAVVPPVEPRPTDRSVVADHATQTSAPPPAPPATPPIPRPPPPPSCPAFQSRWGPMPGEHISREIMGAEWPLTVASGCLYCGGPRAVVFVSGGRSYGINGTATPTYGEPDPIWSENPELHGARVNIHALLVRGLAICDRR